MVFGCLSFYSESRSTSAITYLSLRLQHVCRVQYLFSLLEKGIIRVVLLANLGPSVETKQHYAIKLKSKFIQRVYLAIPTLKKNNPHFFNGK